MHNAGRKILALLLLIPLALGALALGVFFFALALAAVTLLFAVIYLRLWWLRRKLRASKSPGPVLEGEFHVVSAREQNRQDREHHRS